MTKTGICQHGQIRPPELRQHFQRHPVEHIVLGPIAQRFAHQQTADIFKPALFTVMAELCPILFFVGSATHFIKEDGTVKGLSGRIQLVALKIGEHLEAPADQRAAGYAATQTFITPVRHISVPCIGIVPRQIPLRIAVGRFDFAHNIVGKQHPADDIFGIRHHFSRLGKVIEHMRAVKAGNSGLHTDKIGGGTVGITGENLGIVPNHIKINVRQHSYAVAASDYIENRFDGRIGKSSHQILGTFFGMLTDISLGCQCMGHFHHLNAKKLLHAALTQFISPADLRHACCAPGQADSSYFIARFQMLRFLQFQHRIAFLSVSSLPRFSP